MSTQGGVTQSLICRLQGDRRRLAGRPRRALVDEPTRAEMSERSNWKGLLDTPPLPPETEFFPPQPTETP